MTLTLIAPAPKTYRISVRGEKGSKGDKGDAGDGTASHHVLEDLDLDDHPQYHNDARGDARYYTKSQTDAALASKADGSATTAALAGKAASSHTHAYTDITGLGTMATQNASGVSINGGAISNVSITGLGTPSSPTDAVNKSYVDTLNATGMKAPHDVIDCSTNPNYPAAATAGMQWVISVAGKIGGASGKSVEVDDVIQSLAPNAGGTQAAVGSSWHIGQGNIVGALLSAMNLGDVQHAPTALANIGGQPIDPTTTAFAALPIAANKLPYGTGTDTFALADFTAFMRTLLDDPDQATALATLGAQPVDPTITAFAALTIAADKLPYGTGTDTFALADFTAFARTLLDDPDQATALLTLGAQASSDELSAYAALSTTGIVCRTAANTIVPRTLTGTTNVITVTNGNGVSGNPTFTVGNLVMRNDTFCRRTQQQPFGAVTLTDGASIAWNCSSQESAFVTLAGNRTLANPSNMVDGGTYQLRVKQDATGGRTLAYGSAYDWGVDGPPTLSTGANKIDILTFTSDGTKMYGAYKKGFG